MVSVIRQALPSLRRQEAGRLVPKWPSGYRLCFLGQWGRKVCFLERLLKVSEFSLNHLDWIVLDYVLTLKRSPWAMPVSPWGHHTPRAWLSIWVEIRKGVPIVTLAAAP